MRWHLGFRWGSLRCRETGELESSRGDDNRFRNSYRTTPKFLYENLVSPGGNLKFSYENLRLHRYG